MPIWQVALESLTQENDELRQILACNRAIIRAAMYALHQETRRGDTLQWQQQQLVVEYRGFRERLLLASLPDEDV
jgi:tRNA A22 N-methylase